MNLFSERPSAADFATLAAALILGKGFAANSKFIAKKLGASERVLSVVDKAGVASGSTGDESWAGALTDYRAIQEGFLESIRSISLFDSLIPYIKRVPPRTIADVVTSGATGTTVREGSWVPLTRLSITGHNLDAIKSQALIVLTEELIKYATPGSATLWADELRKAVALQTDRSILPILLAGVTAEAATDDADADFLTAFEAINLGQTSRPLIAMAPQILKRLCFLSTGSGRQYPDLTLQGGNIAGAPVVPCDALHNWGSDGDVILVVDAAQLAGDSISIGLNLSTETSIAMADDGLSPPEAQSLINLFQTNSAAVLAERWICLARLTECVAAIKNAAYVNS